MSVAVASTCDCLTPMFSTGWAIAIALLLLVGSVVAVARSSRAATRQDEKDPGMTDDRLAGGPEDGRARIG